MNQLRYHCILILCAIAKLPLELICKYRSRFGKTNTNNKRDGTGVNCAEFLASLDRATAAIHDIKFKFTSDLHRHLSENNFAQNPRNRGIYVEIPTAVENFIIKAHVYPETTHIDIGCTFDPIQYTPDGAAVFSSMAHHIRETLLRASNGRATIPFTSDWMITQRHFGKDGDVEYSGDAFHITFRGQTEEMMRAYVKIMPDGRKIPRIEKIDTTKNRFHEEIQRMLVNVNPHLNICDVAEVKNP